MAGQPTTDELLRARRKLVALERAKFALQQRFDKIDFEMDVIRPQIEALEEAAANGALPEITLEDETEDV
jgi:hypothetical protein